MPWPQVKGKPRSRNKDGTIRKKRSDAGVPRGMKIRCLEITCEECEHQDKPFCTDGDRLIATKEVNKDE